jgi:hypothetical protein
VKPGKDSKVCYNVLEESNESMQSKADLIHVIDERIKQLIKHIQIKHPNHKVTLNCNRYKGVVHEAEPELDTTTYTINKSDIFMCLSSRDGRNEIYDTNTLMYVMIHELAHIFNDTIGHTETFNETFIFLLQNAIEINIYSYVDYNKFPINYCGLILDSQILG